MNLSCVSVNFIIWTMRLGASRIGQFCSCVAPCIYIMFGYSLPRDVHLAIMHVHGRGHDVVLGAILFVTNICECVVSCVRV